MDAGDKYRVPDSEREGAVLPNLQGFTNLHDLELAEAKGFIAAQLILRSELNASTKFDLRYIMRIHKLAFGEVYSFAGKPRTVDISKGGFRFPSALHLDNTLHEFDRTVLSDIQRDTENILDLIEDIAKVHAELLFIHPFREGDGRTARVLANLMAEKAGHDRIPFERLDNKELFTKYIAAVQYAPISYEPMKNLISLLFLP